MKQIMNVISYNKLPSSIFNIDEKSEDRVLKRRRRGVQQRVDRELEKGNLKAALSLVKKHFPAFGIAADAGKVTKKNASSFEGTNVNGDSRSLSLESLIDSILHSVKCSLTFQLLEEETEEDPFQNFGELVDHRSSNSLSEDHQMCMRHEAGHFLIGYVLGILPKKYKVPSMEDLIHNRFAGGKVEFIGFEFLSYVDVATMPNKRFNQGKLSMKTLKKFTCVILGGLVAEHLTFGYSELLHSDVQKLDKVLKWLGFTSTEIDFEVRRAAENAVLILSRHSEAHLKLAEAMAMGRSVGFCIDTIERTLNFDK